MVLYKNNIDTLIIIVRNLFSSSVARVFLDFPDSKILKGACVGKRIFVALPPLANFNYFTVTLISGHIFKVYGICKQWEI